MPEIGIIADARFSKAKFTNKACRILTQDAAGFIILYLNGFSAMPPPLPVSVEFSYPSGALPFR